MALTGPLSREPWAPKGIHTKLNLKKVGDGFSITRIDLEIEAEISGLDDATFHQYAPDAKQNCPESKALAAAEIHLIANFCLKLAV